MRIVTSPNFCKACLEGLWLSLMRRVILIDSISTHCEPVVNNDMPLESAKWKRTFDIKLVPLGQFRMPENQNPDASKERYTIVWTKGEEVMEEFHDKTHAEVDDENGSGAGQYHVDVEFATEEVRVDPLNLMRSSGKFTVPACSH